MSLEGLRRRPVKDLAMEVKRTLVKSGPELWAELTDPGALARHLGPFGSVRITRTTPETLVEWEGDHAAGTVRLEPSGFGTRVVLTSVPPEAPEPPRASFWARMLRREAERPPAPGLGESIARRVLEDCLDALGSARHRPFSRV
jgi:hypothetical protein